MSVGGHRIGCGIVLSLGKRAKMLIDNFFFFGQ